MYLLNQEEKLMDKNPLYLPYITVFMCAFYVFYVLFSVFSLQPEGLRLVFLVGQALSQVFNFCLSRVS